MRTLAFGPAKPSIKVPSRAYKQTAGVGSRQNALAFRIHHDAVTQHRRGAIGKGQSEEELAESVVGLVIDQEIAARQEVEFHAEPAREVRLLTTAPGRTTTATARGVLVTAPRALETTTS